jgi:hypothetical protein
LAKRIPRRWAEAVAANNTHNAKTVELPRH